MLTNTTGAENVAIGFEAGRKNCAGDSNVLIGCQAGCDLKSGNCNVLYMVALNETISAFKLTNSFEASFSIGLLTI